MNPITDTEVKQKGLGALIDALGHIQGKLQPIPNTTDLRF